MSRSRNIKPGFFKNELLVELAFEYRLLFIGLWTMADRAGRLEDRPTKIRMELFPADDVDVNAGLQALHDAGFVQRYEVAGKKLIQVLAWAKHQNPHIKEAKSTLPAPDEHHACTGQAPAKADTSPADSLIPDSLIPLKEPKSKEPMPSRGSRLPKDWVLPDDWRAWAVAQRPGLDVDLEAAKFADFWHAKAGKDATKLNWEGVWRNWIRNARIDRGSFTPVQRPLSAMERVEANIAKGIALEHGEQLTLEGDSVRILTR